TTQPPPPFPTRRSSDLILSALVDNAIKFSPNGGTVTLAARRTGDGIELRVEDEGVGIPLSEQERIFRKFYRGMPTPSSSTRSSRSEEHTSELQSPYDLV